MKHHIRTLACGAALLAAIAAVACGGKQTMASKSAAAYDEAKRKGIPIASGEHGGHSAKPGAEPAPDINQPAMTGMDHGAMVQHGTSGAAAHGMPGMDHSTMAGMDHSMAGMQHGTPGTAAHAMAGMDHSAMPGMSHGSMPGVQHGGTMAGMPGMQHGSPAVAPIVIAPPTLNAAIAQTQPAATLRPDKFDAPAPAAVEEAAKGATAMSHSMEATPKPPAPPQHDHTPQPQPPSEHHHGGDGEAS